MFLVEIIENKIYHAFKNVDYALKALEDNTLYGYSIQRYWPDGRRRKDNEEDYRGSPWLKGVSATRDIEYAKKWGYIIFVLDKDIIKRNYKIIPYNWGYSIPNQKHHKREKEEFIVTGKINPTEQEGGDVPFSVWHDSYVGKIPNLNFFLLGIYAGKVRPMEQDIDTIIEHPKFLGYY